MLQEEASSENNIENEGISNSKITETPNKTNNNQKLKLYQLLLTPRIEDDLHKDKDKSYSENSYQENSSTKDNFIDTVLSQEENSAELLNQSENQNMTHNKTDNVTKVHLVDYDATKALQIKNALNQSKKEKQAHDEKNNIAIEAQKVDYNASAFLQIKIADVRSLSITGNMSAAKVSTSLDVSDSSKSSNLFRQMLNDDSNSKIFGIARDYDEKNSLLVEVKTKIRDKKYTEPKSHEKDKFRVRVKNFRKMFDPPYKGIQFQNVNDKNKKINRTEEEKNKRKCKEQTLINIKRFQDDDIIDLDKQQPDVAYLGRKHRRKSVHKPYEIAMEFPEEGKDNSLPINTPKRILNRRRTTMHMVKKLSKDIVRDIHNPNADLIKKVAFLRVCVNFMMAELGRKPHLFNKMYNIDSFKTKYVQENIKKLIQI